jgi:(E)-4-hydroxy-3-methylbut-2-enyl-diphosphate synthase
MGCVVNGPGEAREADIGVAGGNGVGILFKKGKVNLAQDLLDNTKNGLETSIMMGESITQ